MKGFSLINKEIFINKGEMQKYDNTEFLSGILLYKNKCKNRVFQIQFNITAKTIL
jgi:hypothetical protein